MFPTRYSEAEFSRVIDEIEREGLNLHIERNSNGVPASIFKHLEGQ